jgi:hypothetical protein
LAENAAESVAVQGVEANVAGGPITRTDVARRVQFFTYIAAAILLKLAFLAIWILAVVALILLCDWARNFIGRWVTAMEVVDVLGSAISCDAWIGPTPVD